MQIVLFDIMLGVLALLAVLLFLARRRRRAGMLTRASITDDMVRQIEHAGYIEVDEPLDIEQIQEEETRFWNEASWEDIDDV